VTLNLVILALATVQRLAELWLSNRNTARLLERGAHEVGASHYPFIVAVHASWLAALWWFAPAKPIHWFWLAFFLLLQVARLWVLVSLRGRWTTRIIILPGEPLVRTGPYRFVDHPNYLIVVGEIAALPLAFALSPIALLFSGLNAAILAVRIRAENRALIAL